MRTIVVLVFAAACAQNTPLEDDIVLSTQDAVVDYAASAPETEERLLFITADVDNLLPFRSSPLKQVRDLQIGNTTHLASLDGIENFERVDRFLIDQANGLNSIAANIEVAGEYIDIQGTIDEIRLPRLRQVGDIILTGYACEVDLSSLQQARSCTTTEDRNIACEPPSLVDLAACTE